MEPATAFKVSLSIIGLGVKYYKYFDSLTPAIERAYESAVNDWCSNDGARKYHANRFYSTLQDFNKYIIDRDGVIKDVELLQKFETNLRADSITYMHILEIILQHTHTQTNIVLQKIDKLSTSVEQFKENTSLQRNILPQITYNSIDGYIQRRIRPKYESQFGDLFEKDKSKLLYQHIIDGKRCIILYSDAQCGKSTELKNLAYELWSSNIYNPFFYSLRGYNNTSLLNTLRISERFNDEKEDVLILDGIDEIACNNLVPAIIEIGQLKEDYPNLIIIVSCRANFESIVTVKNFEKLYIEPLSWNDILEKINNSYSNAQALISEIECRNYYELLGNPFFLEELINYHRENGELPNGMSVLYEYYIKSCLVRENDKNKISIGGASLQHKAYSSLEKIAFCMLSTQQQTITNDMLYSPLQMSSDDVDNCLLTTLVVNNDDGNIEFSHNAFKEYICAKYLSRLTFNQIQYILCYQGSTVIKPTMYNTVVLLLGIIQSNDIALDNLVDWLLQDYKDILVRCGEEVLDTEQRELLMVSMYEDYKHKGLWLENNYTILTKILMQFANTAKSIDFLLKQLQGESILSINAINSLRMLEYADFSSQNGTEGIISVQDILLQFLEKHQDAGEYSCFLLAPFENKSFTDHILLRKIHFIIKDSCNPNIINVFCGIVSHLDQCDEYANWLFSKAKYIHDYTDEHNITHSISLYEFKKNLMKLKNPSNIIQAIIELSKFDMQYSPFSEDDTEKVLLGNLKSNYCNDLEFTKSILYCIDSLDYPKISKNHYTYFRGYFRNYTDYEALFNNGLEVYFNTGNERKKILCNHLKLIYILIDELALNNLLENTQYNEVQKNNLCNRLLDTFALPDSLIDKINIRFNSLHNNYKAIDQLQNQVAMDMLFDHQALVAEVDGILSNTTEVSNDRESYRSFKNSIMNRNKSAIAFIDSCRQILQADFCSRLVNEMITDEFHYKCFIIDQLNLSSYNFAYSYKIELSDEQLQQLQLIVIELINALTETKSKEKIIHVIVNYDLVISEDYLLKLFEYADITVKYRTIEGSESECFLDYLKLKISYIKIDECVKIHILNSTIQNTSFWLCIVKYICSENRSNLDLNLKSLLTKFNDETYRYNVIISLVSMGKKGVSILKNMLTELSDNLQLYSYREILFPEETSYLTPKDRVCICEYLENKYLHCDLNDKSSENIEAMRILLALGSNKALEFWLSFVKVNKEWITDKHFPYLGKYMNVNIDILIEYFWISIPGSTEAKKRRSTSVMIDRIVEVLILAATISENNRDKVIYLFKTAAKENELQYLNRIADSIPEKYYLHNSGLITLPDAYLLFINKHPI